MGRIVSELLAEGLTQRKLRREQSRLAWISRPMRALVDLSDKDALHAILDRDGDHHWDRAGGGDQR